MDERPCITAMIMDASVSGCGVTQPAPFSWEECLEIFAHKECSTVVAVGLSCNDLDEDQAFEEQGWKLIMLRSEPGKCALVAVDLKKWEDVDFERPILHVGQKRQALKVVLRRCDDSDIEDRHIGDESNRLLVQIIAVKNFAGSKSLDNVFEGELQEKVFSALFDTVVAIPCGQPADSNLQQLYFLLGSITSTITGN